MERPVGKRAARRKRSRERSAPEVNSTRRRYRLRRLLRISGLAVVLVGAVVGVVFYFALAKTLPPTGWSPGTHPETWPAARILDEPIPFGVQQHIMEHDQGTRDPGIIVQYNCREYSCSGDLVPKLEELVRRYPTRVYLAPYPIMDAKIALTTFKKLETLEEFDESSIVDFIESAFR